MVRISSFCGEYRFLSNFYQSPVEYEGLTYPTAEAAYQAQKCSVLEDRVKYIFIKNPAIAKHMGRREQLPEDWENRVYGIMNAIVRSKFSSPELAEKLRATGHAYLEEGNHWHDNRWGRCSCDSCRDKESQNWLGRILMDIRKELNAA